MSRQMLTGEKGHDVFTQVRALPMEVKPYSCLIDIDDDEHDYKGALSREL